jgi:hypothetical protein
LLHRDARGSRHGNRLSQFSTQPHARQTGRSRYRITLPEIGHTLPRLTHSILFSGRYKMKSVQLTPAGAVPAAGRNSQLDASQAKSLVDLPETLVTDIFRMACKNDALQPATLQLVSKSCHRIVESHILRPMIGPVRAFPASDTASSGSTTAHKAAWWSPARRQMVLGAGLGLVAAGVGLSLMVGLYTKQAVPYLPPRPTPYMEQDCDLLAFDACERFAFSVNRQANGDDDCYTSLPPPPPTCQQLSLPQPCFPEVIRKISSCVYYYATSSYEACVGSDNVTSSKEICKQANLQRLSNFGAQEAAFNRFLPAHQAAVHYNQLRLGMLSLAGSLGSVSLALGGASLARFLHQKKSRRELSVFFQEQPLNHRVLNIRHYVERAMLEDYPNSDTLAAKMGATTRALDTLHQALRAKDYAAAQRMMSQQPHLVDWPNQDGLTAKEVFFQVERLQPAPAPAGDEAV